MNKKYILFIGLGVLIALVSVWGLGKIKGGTASLAPSLSQENKKEENIVDFTGIEDDDPFLGSSEAPVTMVEFSDYQCPFCANFYNQIFSKIKQEYIDTGKVRFVYRDFPLSIHQYAQKSAEASECADEQGKFWEYKDILFKNQGEWSSLGIDRLKDYASELGLNREDFDYCLDSGLMAQEVLNDFSDGRQYGVSGTPAFYINGELISGAQPFEVFKQKIDSLLQ